MVTLVVGTAVPRAHAQAQYAFTNFAGWPGGYGNVDGIGSAARFNYPWGVASDSSGNLYVADSGNYTIRKITPGGAVTTFAGGPGQRGSADGAGSVARFGFPYGIAVGAGGYIYVSDSGNQTIRKITPDGVVSTLAGSAGQSGSDDGTGSDARFNSPSGVALDSSGNIYVAEDLNYTIRKITPEGVVTTLAGTPGQQGGTDGPASTALFGRPRGVAVDVVGNVYVADVLTSTIRKITPEGMVSTLAGSDGKEGSADGIGSAARFHGPSALATDKAGNLYVTDTWNFTIRNVTPAGAVTTFAGLALNYGSADGTGSGASFYDPYGVAVDSAGNVYVADSDNNTVRKITPAAEVTTLAGLARQPGYLDGTGCAARLNRPKGVAVDSLGNVYLADGNNTIRNITPDGEVMTLAGNPTQSGSADGTGSMAQFSSPQGVAVDSAGTVYVADYGNSTIRRISPLGVVTTLAGRPGVRGSNDGVGSAALFRNPYDVAVDSGTNLYVADTSNHTIRKITPDGTVSTLAGSAGQSGSDDGSGSAARFNNPTGVAVDSVGNLYIADRGNSTIREITPGGVVRTLAGSAGQSGSTDGTGSAARFNLNYLYLGGPLARVAVDNAGNVYVTDPGNFTIRKITPHGVVTTVGGAAGAAGARDGIGASAQFSILRGVAVDSAGNLYVADADRIAKGALFVAPAIGPSLALSLNGPTLTVSWPFPSIGFALESTLSLTSSSWKPMLETPVSSNGQWQVTVTTTETQRYFRLHGP